MDLGLSEGQRAIEGLAREVLAAAADRSQAGRRAVPAESFDRRGWEDLGRVGLLAVTVPEEAGGSGGGILDACILLEEAGRAGVPLPVLPTLVAAMTLGRFGDDDQRSRYLRPVAERHVVATMATEADGLRVKDGPDGPRLDGACDHVPAAGEAAWMIVADGGSGLFVVDMAAAADVVPQPEPGGEPLFRVAFSDAPAEPLAGGADGVRWLIEHGLAGRCALQVGLAERALRITADYTSAREQFGRPLASFQAVQQRAADAYIDVETMRLTMWRAAWLLATDQPAAGAVAVAAFFAAEAGQRVMASAQHLHGGIGVDVDYPLHRFVLWSKQVELALGGANRNLARLGASLAITAEEACS